MRPHVFGITAGSVLLLAGCAGDAAPGGAASPAPAVTTTTATVAPSPSVALQPPHTLVYRATGTAAVTSLVHELDGRKTTDTSVTLPWRTVVEIPADGQKHTWRLTVKHRSGRVELVALLDGAPLSRGGGQLSGGGTGTASVSGGLTG